MAKKGKRPAKNKIRHYWTPDCDTSFCPNPEHWQWSQDFTRASQDRGWVLEQRYWHSTGALEQRYWHSTGADARKWELSIPYPRKHRPVYHLVSAFQSIVESAILSRDRLAFRALAVLAFNGYGDMAFEYRETVINTWRSMRKDDL